MYVLQGTPDTGSFLLLGLAAFVVIVGGYVVSYIVRLRNAQNSLALLQQMEAEGAAAQDAPADEPAVTGAQPT